MFRSGESCDRTLRTAEDDKRYAENWDRIFGKKQKLEKELNYINGKRHTIIDSSQAKRIRKPKSQHELESLKRKRAEVLRELDKLNRLING